MALLAQRGACGMELKARFAQGKGYSMLILQDSIPPGIPWWRPPLQNGGYSQMILVDNIVTIPILVMSPANAPIIIQNGNQCWQAYRIPTEHDDTTLEPSLSPPISYSLMFAPILLALLTYASQLFRWQKI